MKIFLLLIFASSIFSQEECQEGRYLDDLFEVDVEYNIEFGQNTNQTILGSSYTQELYMDVYTPSGDNFNERPLIFFMFGGSFVTGSKLSADIVNLCNQYAKRGYVAVAIDYRLSQNLLFFDPNEENAYKAVLKAVHDLKAAIRYFRMMDEISSETFRIDSNRIYAGGVSAGAIVAVNGVYLNEISEVPSFLMDEFDDLGGFDGLSGNPGYDSNYYGVVNLCGAIGSIEWIEENDVPIVSMHGDQDDVIPYDENLVTLFGLDIIVDGSYIIHQRMLDLGNYSNLHTYVGQGHVPFSNIDMTFEAEFTTTFLYDVVCEEEDSIFGDINGDESVDILDIVTLVTSILNEGTNQNADLNEDGSVNILDIIVLVNTILNS